MEKKKIVINISIIILVFTIIATIGGLILENLYRDNDFLKIVWKSNDFMVLIFVVPLLIFSIIYLSRSNSYRVYLIILGLLDFTLYNYGYYLFGTSFNWFFLFYVLIYVLSAVAIIIALTNLDVNTVSKSFCTRIPSKLISIFLLFISFSLTMVYVIMTFGFIATGNLPTIIERTEHPTNVVFAMDLSLVVPVFAFAGVWLWQHKPWGYILSTISLVKSTLYNLVLSFVTLKVSFSGYPESISELPLWGFFAFASFIGCILLISNISENKVSR